MAVVGAAAAALDDLNNDSESFSPEYLSRTTTCSSASRSSSFRVHTHMAENHPVMHRLTEFTQARGAPAGTSFRWTHGSFKRSARVAPSPPKMSFAKRKAWFTIDPRHKMRRMLVWDGITTLALLYTAFVTPLEVSFIAPQDSCEEAWKTPLFLINRIIDLIFCFDMLIQFVLITQVVDRVKGVRWVEVRMNALNLQTADANRTREPTFACMYAAQYLLLLPPIS